MSDDDTTLTHAEAQVGWRELLRRVPEDDDEVREPTRDELRRERERRFRMRRKLVPGLLAELVPALYAEARTDDVSHSPLLRQLKWIGESGSSAWLHGPRAAGKTHAAAIILGLCLKREAYELSWSEDLERGVFDGLRPDFGARCRWTTPLDMLADVGDAIGSRVGTQQALARYTHARVLVIDDIGATLRERLTAFQSETLWQVLDGRYQAKRQTIVTSNMSPEDELMGVKDEHGRRAPSAWCELGPRLERRVAERYRVLEMQHRRLA